MFHHPPRICSVIPLLVGVFLIVFCSKALFAQSPLPAEQRLLARLENLPDEEQITLLRQYLPPTVTDSTTPTQRNLWLALARAQWRKGSNTPALTITEQLVNQLDQPVNAEDSLLLGKTLNLQNSIYRITGETVSRTQNTIYRAYGLLKAQFERDATAAATSYYEAVYNYFFHTSNQLDFPLAEFFLKTLQDADLRHLDESLERRVLLSAGYLAANQMDYQRAAEAYTAALADERIRPNSIHEAYAIQYRGGSYTELQNYRRAMEDLDESRRALAKLCNPEDGNYACVLLNQDASYRIGLLNKMGQYEEADEAFNAAIATTATIRSDALWRSSAMYRTKAATTSSLLGSTREAEDRFHAALQLIVDSTLVTDRYGLPLIDRITPKRKSSLVTHLMARFQHYARQPDQASQFLAITVHEKLDSFIYRAGQRTSLSSPLFNNDPEVRSHYEEVIRYAVDLAERYPEEAERCHELFYRTISAQKGNALRRRLDVANIAAAANLPTADMEKRQRLRTALADLRSQLGEASPGSTEDIRSALVATSFDLQQLDDSLSRRYPLFANVFQRPVLPASATLSTTLPQDLALVDFMVGRRNIYASLLTREQGLRCLVLPLPAQLDSLVQEVVKNGTVAQQLYGSIVRPLLADLPAGVDRLQFIPDGALWYLPFPALRKANRYLIEDYAVSLAYSVQSLYHNQNVSRQPDNGKFLGVGIDYLPVTPDPAQLAISRALRFGPLPEAPAEARAGAERLDGLALINEEATAANFVANYRGRAVLHFATHGLLNEMDPFRSALVFRRPNSPETELFSLADIISLPDLDQTKLVVLNACHTQAGALQPGEGLHSLARGFHLAGVGGVLASQWEVNDQVGALLAERLYDKLADGHPVDKGLQLAIIDHLNEARPGIAGPDYWAGMTMIGSSEVIVANNWFAARWLLPASGLLLLGLTGAWWFSRKS